MILPIINNNGTSREEHIELRKEAIRALNAAIERLRALTPNGRDYPGETDRCVSHREMHYARIATIETVSEELLAEAVAIKMEI